jgi:hypothetical protein
MKSLELDGGGDMGETPSAAVDPKELARLTESLAKLTREYEGAREKDTIHGRESPDPPR